MPLRDATNVDVTEALYHPGGRHAKGTDRWRRADVISMSFTFAYPLSDVSAAIAWVVLNGRDGFGCPMLAAQEQTRLTRAEMRYCDLVERNILPPRPGTRERILSWVADRQPPSVEIVAGPLPSPSTTERVCAISLDAPSFSWFRCRHVLFIFGLGMGSVGARHGVPELSAADELTGTACRAPTCCH